MIVLRVYRGIADHFPMRVTEWAMLWPALGMGLALKAQPEMFQTSPSFAQLAAWGDESFWAMLVLACVVVRLIALTVNGTFSAFRYAPHFRAIASFSGVWFWSQYCLGFTLTAAFYGGAWSGPVMYSTAVILELVNVFRSVGDVRRVREA